METLKDVEQRVSARCLHGRPMPRALSRLWEAQQAGDLDRIELLDSLDVLEPGYGPAVAAASEEVAANVRAHRRVFARLGFFARTVGDMLLAIDLESANREDPPVVELDTEGMYSWSGRNIADALFQADDRSDRRREWLDRHGLEGAQPGDPGASTQFLPSLGDLHKRYYAEESGRPPKPPFVRRVPARGDDPISWIGRPAAEVEPILREVLGLGTAPFPKQWVACDADGNIATVWLRRREVPSHLTVNGVGFVATKSTVRAALGQPEKSGTRASWDLFIIDGVTVNVAYDDDAVELITLMDRSPV
jgi:hypothetical protein